jgi:hypothetical protein
MRGMVGAMGERRWSGHECKERAKRPDVVAGRFVA